MINISISFLPGLISPPSSDIHTEVRVDDLQALQLRDTDLQTSLPGAERLCNNVTSLRRHQLHWIRLNRYASTIAPHGNIRMTRLQFSACQAVVHLEESLDGTRDFLLCHLT